jgi:hypothetical protein
MGDVDMMMGKYYLKKHWTSLWAVFVWLRKGTSEHYNGSFSAIKGDTYLGKLNNH